MGSIISCRLGHPPSEDVVKVVHSNGYVNQLPSPVRAKQLLAHYPQSLICRSTDLSFVHPPHKLDDDDELQLGYVYFLLPSSFFYSVPSRSDIAALLAKAEAARKAGRKSFIPKRNVCAPGEVSNMVQDSASSNETAPDAHEARAAYKSHLISRNCKAWRPALKTIDESSLKIS